MKGLLLIFFIFFLAHETIAQPRCDNFDDLMKSGESEFHKGRFLSAINKYQAAIIDCPGRASEVQPEILCVFKRIDRLRNEANIAKDSLRNVVALLQRTQAELRNAVREANDQRDEAFRERFEAFKSENKMRVQQSLNQKLLNAFYFYEDSLALAYKNGKFGYVNKLGEVVLPYQYDRASNFHFPGFAEIEKPHGRYLLDTKGQEYYLARTVSEIVFHCDAIKLDNSMLKTFPNRICDETVRLRVLILDGNSIKNIPIDIARLRSLETFSFADNRVRSIPMEIRNLRRLKRLYASGNRIESLTPFMGKLDSLRELHIDRNLLTALPSQLVFLKSLRVLNLSSNQLVVFPNVVSTLSSLEILQIGHNPCSDTPEKRESILQEMKRLVPKCKVLFD